MTGWAAVATGLVLTAFTLAWYAWWSRPRPARRRVGRPDEPPR